MKDTLFLNPGTWDLEIDAFANIALAATPYAQAQDVACACRLWKGEARYDTTKGIPYPDSILGQTPPARLLAGWFEKAAKTVPGIKAAAVSLQYTRENRGLSGQIALTLTNGAATNVNI